MDHKLIVLMLCLIGNNHGCGPNYYIVVVLNTTGAALNRTLWLVGSTKQIINTKEKKKKPLLSLIL